MYEISRRRFVVGAATAGAVFGLGKAVEFTPSAWAQGGPVETGLNPKKLQFFRFTMGDMEVFQIFEGENTRPHSDGFIRNASVDDTKKALTAAGLKDDAVPNAFTVTVVKTGGRTIMFDSGLGTGTLPATGRLAENLKAAGIEQKDINLIVVSHYHPDHIFGLMDKDNAQIYPNAEIVMPEAEYGFWTDPAKTSKLPEGVQGLAKRVQATFPNWKNIRQVGDNAEVAPGIRSISTHGHTPGHTSYVLSSGGRQHIVLADITNIPQIFVKNPGWHVMFDADAASAEANRRRMFDRAIADKATLGGYHWGMPGCGTLAKDGNSYVFTPMA
jgi:glyoxylase-like metal-dependent hydrolase (beta-lactamase superfamily II)